MKGTSPKVLGSSPSGGITSGWQSAAFEISCPGMDFRIPRRAGLGGLGRAALLPPAAFAVHQLRYLLAYGGGAGAELRETGHSYLHSIVPWLVALIAFSAGGFLVSLGRAFTRHTNTRRFTLSFSGLWVACSAALIGIFVCQELLEGLFATGHPGGLSGVFGFGGWWSVPASACIGLMLAAILHGARWAVERIVHYLAHRPVTRRAEQSSLTPQSCFVALPAPLLAGWSTRGPPT